MTFTLPGLLYATYTILAFGIALFAVAVALRRHHELGRRRAAITIAAGALLLPVCAMCIAGSLPYYGFLLPASALLPVLCIAATITGAETMPGKRLGTKALTLAACAWNTVLAVLYGLRAAQLLFHAEIGDIGSGLLAALAAAQRNVGSELAETLPIFVYAPILLPPLRSRGTTPLAAASGAGFLATFTGGLLAVALPGGLQLAQAMRQPARDRSIGPRGDIEIAMAVGDPRWLPPPDQPAFLTVLGNTPGWQARLDRAGQLGVTALDLPVAADVVHDEVRFQYLERIVRRIRRAGLSLRIVVQPPARIRGRLHHGEFQRQMQEAHWILTERLAPDLLVLFSRPFDVATERVVGKLPVSRWAELVQESAAALRRGQPGRRTAIDLAPLSERAEQLFVLVSESSSGPDEVRFVIAGNRSAGPTVARALIRLGGWLAAHPTHTRIALVGVPPTPLSQGGFVAQSGYLRRLIGFAAAQPLVGSVTVGPMLDGRQGLNGFWDNRDIPRPCVPLLYDLLRRMCWAR